MIQTESPYFQYTDAIESPGPFADTVGFFSNDLSFPDDPDTCAGNDLLCKFAWSVLLGGVTNLTMPVQDYIPGSILMISPFALMLKTISSVSLMIKAITPDFTSGTWLLSVQLRWLAIHNDNTSISQQTTPNSTAIPSGEPLRHTLTTPPPMRMNVMTKALNLGA